MQILILRWQERYYLHCDDDGDDDGAWALHDDGVHDDYFGQPLQHGPVDDAPSCD